jgi:hypothetical protein
MADRDDLGTDTDRLVWAPHMLKRVRKRPTDAIREAREARLCEMAEVIGDGRIRNVAITHRNQLKPVTAPWLYTERAYRRGAVTYAGGVPRGERRGLVVLCALVAVLVAAQLVLWWAHRP